MPLRLKSLELHGYKTFAAKTNFEFAEGITAIVGPNGSGKSNIADAFRWVLGEQSYSLLRAKKTEDMIFIGSEQRPRAGMASAGVTFDNSEGWLPVDFSEVALARRSYRDGRNEYLLNNQHVRLKDINELLAQSGLSERTYTILGQGLVDASLALKADERRRLFEEAAGIGLYRTRREEALRRLETTQRNLDRVQDILAELEPRLKSLERQAARAQEFSRLQADLRVLLLEWYGFHWHRAQLELKDALNLARLQEVKLAEANGSYQRVRQDFTTFRDRQNSLRARLNSWHRHSAQLHESRESTSGQLAVLDERQRTLLDNRQTRLSEQSQMVGEFKLFTEKLEESGRELERLQTEFEEANQQVRLAQAALEGRQKEKLRLEEELQSIRHIVEEFSARRTTLSVRHQELSSRIDDQKQRQAALDLVVASTETEASKAAKDLSEAALKRERAEASLQAVSKALQLSRNQQLDLESQMKEKQTDLSSNQTEEARIRAQLDVLEQAEQSLTGYAEGARLLLEASRQARLTGSRGALSGLLDVPEELESAITAVLGEFSDAILIESDQDAEQAILYLDSREFGRVSLLPMETLFPLEPLKREVSDDCLGVASDLISVEAEYRPVVDLLLGQVLVVRDRATAHRVLAGEPGYVRAVTLRGEVFHASGQVIIGKPGKTALGRPRQKRELQKSIRGIKERISGLESEIRALSKHLEFTNKDLIEHEGVLENVRYEFELARNAEVQAQIHEESLRELLNWQTQQKKNIGVDIALSEKEIEDDSVSLAANEKDLAQFEETLRTQSAMLAAMPLEEYQEQVKFWSTRSAVAERVLQAARDHYEERRPEADRLREQQTLIESRLAEIDKSLEEVESTKKNLRDQISGINHQLEELRTLIGPAEEELAATDAMESDLQKQEAEGQIALARVERTHNQIQLELSRKQEVLTNLSQKIEDDFGLVDFEYASEVSGPVPLPFEGMVKQLPVVNELPPDLEENMSRLRAQLRRMGPINPEAQTEYQSVKERHDFLVAQMADLHKAEADLRQVIAELDDLTRREFQKTFDSVADQFHMIFHRLFDGGAARLVLTDPDNLTETGIDIEARLPGRREQGLSLLSGGERSLTAIALVFSLLKVSPTPVCVMDEVDAMLDEANVGRFRDLLLELSQETQFIIITHNRNTVQAADVIYGVTMGRDSTSQIISLKLDEVSEDYLK